MNIFQGFTGGGFLRIVPLYIGEIAEVHIRGKLGAYFPLGLNFGIFLAYVLGTYLEYFIIPFVLVPFVLLYFVLMLLMKETPQCLLKKGRDEKALESLMFYRNCHDKDSKKFDDVEKEFENLKKNISHVSKSEVKLKDFRK